ncbi:MAG: O-antigen ligase family protein [Candidatus Promineifilaceae bacterium]|jgi:putative inorganic carbon (HCO3(-)) transporter
MTLRKDNRRGNPSLWVLAAARWHTSATIQTPVIQWSIAVSLGLALGFFLLIALAWNSRWAPFLALAALFPFIAIISGDLRKFLLMVLLLELPMNLDLALLYDVHAVELNATGGLSYSITGFCLVCLYALWFIDLLIQKSTSPRLLPSSLPLLIYLAAVVLSMAVAQDRWLAAFEIFLLGQSFLLFIYIIKTVQNRQDLLFVVTLLLAGLAYESVVMIGLRILGHSVRFAHIMAGIDASGRVYGTIGSPNTAASYLTLLLAPTLSVLLTTLKAPYKWLAGLAFGLGTAALLLTFSRGGWLAFIISIALLCLFAFFRGWLSPGVPLVIAASSMVLVLLLWKPITDRLFGDDLGAAQSRSIMWKQALQVIEANPVLGVGSNNYAIWYEQRYSSTTIQPVHFLIGTKTFWYEQHFKAEIDGRILRTVHNKFLLVWAETGIIGLVTFLGFLFAVIRWGWQGWQLQDRLLSPLALGFTVAIVGQMVHMCFDLFHSRPQIQLLWVVAALVIAIRNMDASDG